MIEVKGPGDRLQDNQLRWIEYCAEHQMPSRCAICNGRMKRYTIAVRALCEFTAKTGDLDLRFTPSPTAQEGIAGHATVTARRGMTITRPNWRWPATSARCMCAAAPTATTAQRNRWKKSRPIAAILKKMPDNQRQLHWAQVKSTATCCASQT
jgi:hypothetical protein